MIFKVNEMLNRSETHEENKNQDKLDDDNIADKLNLVNEEKLFQALDNVDS